MLRQYTVPSLCLPGFGALLIPGTTQQTCHLLLHLQPQELSFFFSSIFFFSSVGCCFCIKRERERESAPFLGLGHGAIKTKKQIILSLSKRAVRKALQPRTCVSVSETDNTASGSRCVAVVIRLGGLSREWLEAQGDRRPKMKWLFRAYPRPLRYQQRADSISSRPRRDLRPPVWHNKLWYADCHSSWRCLIVH